MIKNQFRKGARHKTLPENLLYIVLKVCLNPDTKFFALVRSDVCGRIGKPIFVRATRICV